MEIAPMTQRADQFRLTRYAALRAASGVAYLRYLGCSMLLLSSLLLAPLPAVQVPSETVASSTDVRRLEAIAGSWDEAAKLGTYGMNRAAKDVRTTAYARLGELGTPESLEAIRRIEQNAQTAWRKRTVRLDAWTHPSWHFSDFDDRQKIATFNVGGGLAYTIVRDSGLLGDDDSFLLTGYSTQSLEWQGPWLIPKPDTQDCRTINLVFSESRGILIAFTKAQEAMLKPMNPVVSGCFPKINLEGITTWVSVKEILQDSDGDHLTDLEEERLGLDPNNIDTDADGLPDGSDICPDYTPGLDDARDENRRILQRAIFATFGLSGSQDLILVDPSSTRLQVWGYAGPIIYKADRKNWIQHHSGGLWVSWRVVSKHDDEAEVDIGDYLGPLAAGGQSVSLRRISGDWYVVKRTTGWVS